MKFIINGDPIPQARHRTYRKKGKNINYDPCSDQKSVHMVFLRNHAILFPNVAGNDYYHVSLFFYFKIPKSDSKTIRDKKLSGILQHTSTPDLDNLEKFILDCMTGIFFSDDKKVVKLQSEKKWAEKGYTEIQIEGFSYGPE